MKKLKKFCLVLLSLTLILCQAGEGNYVYANVNDNVLNSALEVKVGETNDSGRSTLFGLLNQLFDVIGIARIDNVPEEDEYPQATLIEKVNYIEKELRQVFQYASDGKLSLQSSLAKEGISISTADPQPFATINDALKNLIAKYKTQLGQLDAELIKARAAGTLIVSTRGFRGKYDGYNHNIAVSTDTDNYNVFYGTSSSNCTQTTSPVYKNAGTYNVYYKVVGKTNNKELCGSEVVEILRLPGSFSISKSYAEIVKDNTTTVTASNYSGGNVTATSSNTGIATVSKSGNTFTITAKSAGTCTISFVGAANGNYEGGSATMSVKVITCPPGNFSTAATWSDVQTIVQMGRMVDQGFEVGQTREVDLTEMGYGIGTVTLVHMYELWGGDVIYCMFTGFSETPPKDRINWRDHWLSNYGGWAACETREYLNGPEFYGKLPEDFKGVLADTIVAYGDPDNYRAEQRCTDKLFLPGAKEITGNVWAVSMDMSGYEWGATEQWDYFKEDTLNRTKLVTSEDQGWYTRTPSSGADDCWLCVPYYGYDPSSGDQLGRCYTSSNLCLFPAFSIE